MGSLQTSNFLFELGGLVIDPFETCYVGVEDRCDLMDWVLVRAEGMVLAVGGE